MNLFNKKNISFQNNEKHTPRRNFLFKTLAALAGFSLIAKASKLFSKDSETGFMYIKPNGERIYNYKPQGSDPYLGEICIYGFSYAPRGWNYCDGSLINISENQELFNLIGTTYGGDGVTNFALPNFIGNMPLGAGSGPGLTPRSVGQTGGSTQVTLLLNQIPSHNHVLNCSINQGDNPSPQGNFIAVSGDTSFSTTSDNTLSPSALSFAGNNYPVDLTQPNLSLNFCIATSGIYPQAN